jgi:hypothetical protein
MQEKRTDPISLVPIMTVSSRYFFLLALQTIGAGILFCYSVPLYRQVLMDPAGHEVRSGRLLWSLSSIALMQGGYWARHRLNPSLPQFRNALLGHVIQFVGRLAFVFAGSVFGFAFIIRRPELQVPFSRYVVLIVGLFAVFCYFRELERLGTAIGEPKDRS